MLWLACTGLCSREHSRQGRVSQEIWQHLRRLSLARSLGIVVEGRAGLLDAKGVNVGPILGAAMFCDFIVTLARATAGPYLVARGPALARTSPQVLHATTRR